jgi:cystathionine beta-lyase/cystathionine gamma-synthase
MKKDTQCVHRGTFKDPDTRGVNTPIYTSSAFQYLDAADTFYPRYFNTPNQRTLINKLCALENAEEGLIFSSGMAAVSTVLFSFLNSGDHVVLQKDIYGGTHHFVTAEFERFGIQYTFTSNKTEDIAKAVRDNTKVIYIETPSNPLILITDVKAVAQIARSQNILSVIDISVHSGTKYLGGHSDICCGAALGSKNLIEKVKAAASNFGGSLNAITCYLLERSLKTLSLRVEKQNRNALIIARHLQNNPAVKEVYYPGLENHPGHAVAREQMRGFGGMLAFELGGKTVDAVQFQKRLKLIAPAVSLGGVETLICSPVLTSHAKISTAEQVQLGITPQLLRLSVGIEDPDDLIADIEQALSS